MKNINHSLTKLVFVLVLTFVSFLGKGQVDFRVVNYSSVSGVSLTFKVQIKSPGSTTLGSNVVPIVFSNALVTGFTSITYAGNYSGYSSGPTFSAGTLTVSTTAPGSPTTIANTYEDYFTIVMVNTGTVSDLTNIAFGSITGVSVGTTTGINNAPLPVKFITATAENVGDDVVLNWATATEKNNEFFYVERSTDGVNFITISRLNGANISNNVRHYSYSDIKVTDVAKNVLYYRIIQTDYDDKSSPSKILKVKINNVKQVIAVYPNPAIEFINVVYSSVDNNDVVITLSDEIGNAIQTVTKTTTIGENQTTLDLTEIGRGMYFINIKIAGNMHAFKVIKLE